MESKKQMRREGAKLVLKNILQDKMRISDLAIIDLRSCIRDAMAAAIRNNSQMRVFTANSSESLIETEFCSNPSSRQLIVFCDGALDSEAVNQELFKLCAYKNNARVALFTDGDLNDIESETLRALDGVIPSYYETEQVLACIQVIDSGIKYLPFSTYGNCTENNTVPSIISKEAGALLTPRQRQVMQYISEGRANKYIAAELSVSESTIKVHVHEVMKRLGATSRTHAVYLLGNIQ